MQLLYIGISAFVVAGFVEFLDEKDRFFTPKILEITIYEWGLYIGIACLGMLQESVNKFYQLQYFNVEFYRMLKTYFTYYILRDAWFLFRV